MRIILIGNRQLLLYLSQQYLSKGYQISIIDKDKDACEYLANHLKALIIHGDATDPQMLTDADAGSSQILVALTSTDYINLICCQLGKYMFNIPKTLALINEPDNFQVYKQMGIEHIFNKAELIFGELEEHAETDYLHHIVSYAEEQLQIYEVLISEEMPSSGVEIVALGLPRSTVVIGIIRNSKLSFPGRDFIIAPNDRIIIAATPETFSMAVRLICGKQA